jgi:Mg2+-importing ATPase
VLFRSPFIESRPSAALLIATSAIMAIGISLPMGPIASYFKFQPLPWTYFPLLLLILAGYMVLTQGMKRFYTRHFGWQ